MTLHLIMKMVENNFTSKIKEHTKKFAKIVEHTAAYQKVSYHNQFKKPLATPKVSSTQDGVCFKKELTR